MTKRLILILALLALPLIVGLLFTYDVLKVEWISLMEIQPSFNPQEDPLPLPPNSIPIHSISVNGKAITAYRGTSYFADAADSRTVTEKNISREIPPFSDTVIDF